MVKQGSNLDNRDFWPASVQDPVNQEELTDTFSKEENLNSMQRKSNQEKNDDLFKCYFVWIIW